MERGLESTTEELKSNSASGSYGEDTKDAKDKTTEKDVMSRDRTDKITADCDNVFAFPQVVTFKALQVAAIPLSLCADKRAGGWFWQYLVYHIDK